MHMEKILYLNTVVLCNHKKCHDDIIPLFCVMKTDNHEFDLGQLLCQYWVLWLTENGSFQQ